MQTSITEKQVNLDRISSVGVKGKNKKLAMAPVLFK